MFRVIRVREDLITYHGWVWLDGYELDATGDATRRREIFVRRDGLRPMTVHSPPRPAGRRAAPTPPRRNSRSAIHGNAPNPIRPAPRRTAPTPGGEHA
nr:hypothetical protein [Micromonospora yangpuensis]